jgi:transcriptional regulator
MEGGMRVGFPSKSEGRYVESDLDLLRGTLDVLVLKSLIFGARHGYDVAAWILETSRDTLRVDEGALYTSLHRMENREWLESEWGISDNNRRAKYYKLTAKGRAQLKRSTADWTRYAEAVFLVLRAS